MIRRFSLACRTLVFFTLALIAGLLMQSIGAPVHSSAATANQTVIHVIEHPTDTIIDNAPVGDSPGDLDVYSASLYNATDQVQVGNDQGVCTRTLVGIAYECHGTIFLNGGQISIEGPYYDHADSTMAITGGTGIYNHARGQMLLHVHNLAGTEYDYTLYLS